MLDVAAAPPRSASSRTRSAGGCASPPTSGRCSRPARDKISLNSAAVGDPSLITQTSRIYGSQCIVVAIDARAVSRAGATAGRSSSTAGGSTPGSTPSSGRGGRAAGCGRDPAHEHGPRRHQGRLRHPAHARHHARAQHPGHRERGRGRARALRRGGRRGGRRRRARRKRLPLRRLTVRQVKESMARAGCPSGCSRSPSP